MSDNISKDNDNGNSKSKSNSNNNKNNIKSADNSDNIDDDISTPQTLSLPAIAIAIENSLVNDKRNSQTITNNTSTGSSIQSHYYPFENHSISRLIRSLDVSGSVAGVGSSSGISSIFSPSPGGGGGAGSLTNIFNQNLDTGLSNNIECPSFDESSACPCYKFEDGKLKKLFAILLMKIILKNFKFFKRNFIILAECYARIRFFFEHLLQHVA